MRLRYDCERGPTATLQRKGTECLSPRKGFEFCVYPASDTHRHDDSEGVGVVAGNELSGRKGVLKFEAGFLGA